MAEAGEHTGNLPTTMSTTLTPTTTSEWQLYRVLQRANLLQYYDTFINQGGDDVQQLCEAGEEEFLEIMALVGMAAKPLHVRRLQKALQEWVANPAAFQGKNLPQTIPAPGSISAVMRDQQATTLQFSTVTTVQQQQQQTQQQQTQQQQTQQQQQQPEQQQQQLQQPTPRQSTPVLPSQSWTPQSLGAQSVSPTPPDAHSPTSMSPHSDVKDPYLVQHAQNSGCNSPSQSTAYLDETQISAIAEAAALLSKHLPPFEVKEANTKKQTSKEIHAVMSMPEDDPNRMDELRKYAAIYGRFDSKRKAERPMTLHEMSVNEAAAQLCRHVPALLTRREDLFPLARQVVRDSGYVYSKGHSRSPNQLEKVRPALLGMTNGFIPGMSGSASGVAGVTHISKAMMSASRSALNDQLIIIGQEMESLNRCQIELRTALDNASPEKKESLLQELEAMTVKMRDFNSQKISIAAQLQRLDRRKKNYNHMNGEDDTDSSVLLSGGSGNSSPREDVIEEGDIGVVRVNPFGRSQSQRLSIRNTLVDVGLRVVKQYEQVDLADVEGICGNSSDVHRGVNSSGRDNEEDESLPVLERQLPAKADYVSGDDDEEHSHPPNLFVQGSDGQEVPMQASKTHQGGSRTASVVNGNGTTAAPCASTTTNGSVRGRKRKNSRPMHHPVSESPTPAKMSKVMENGESPIIF